MSAGFQTNVKTVTPKMQEVTLNGKGKLILTQGLMDQINYLHKKVGGIEWCGILFYKKISGEINKSEDFVLQAEHIYPMNIGSEAYTASDVEGMDIIDMYEKIPNAENLKQGLIHTHHNMSAFFSGVDMSELHDNAPLHNYYLSLIVNFSGNYVAKIAYVAEVENNTTMKMSWNNSKDEPESQVTSTNTTKKVLVMMDLDIEKPAFQEVVPMYFQDRHSFLKDQRDARKALQTTSTSSVVGRGSFKEFEDWEKIGSSKQGSLFNQGEGNIQRTIHPASREAQQAKDASKSAYEKAQQLASNQKGSGKLVGPDGKYVSASEQEIKDLIIDWLNYGLDTDTEMNPSGKFVSFDAALNFYEAWFEKNPHDLDYFLTCMQKYALVIFKDYSLKLVQRKGTQLLSAYLDNNSIAVDLHNILDSILEFANKVESLKNDPVNQWKQYQKSY